MKAVILAAGHGKRLEVFCSVQNKCMFKIRGKSLLEYSLDCAAEINISEIIIVVGYKADNIISAYGEEHKDKKIKYVVQHERKGIVHAIECAKDMIGGEDFMLMLGDEIMVNPRHQKMIKFFQEESILAVGGVVIVEDAELIKRNYSISQFDNNQIYRVIEKPLRPTNNIMGTGNCIFRNEILFYIDRTPINQVRGEKELPDLMQCAIDNGKIIKSFVICERYANINTLGEIKEAALYFE